MCYINKLALPTCSGVWRIHSKTHPHTHTHTTHTHKHSNIYIYIYTHTHHAHKHAHSHIYLSRFSTAWYGMVHFVTAHFWGVFNWVQYLVPGTFFNTTSAEVPSKLYRYQMWFVNPADNWLARENRSLNLRHETLDSLDLNQHSQRRIKTKKWLSCGLLRNYRHPSHW